jgi:hypothetical protein
MGHWSRLGKKGKKEGEEREKEWAA